MCHNDMHRGNVMRNKDGELNPDEIILVDFDAAQYGYRKGNQNVFVILHILLEKPA